MLWGALEQRGLQDKQMYLSLVLQHQVHYVPEHNWIHQLYVHQAHNFPRP